MSRSVFRFATSVMRLSSESRCASASLAIDSIAWGTLSTLGMMKNNAVEVERLIRAVPHFIKRVNLHIGYHGKKL